MADPSDTRPPPTLSRGEKLWVSLLFGGLFALVVYLVLRFELDPGHGPSPRLPWRNGRLIHDDILVLMMGGCAYGALGVIGWGLWRRFSRGTGRWMRRLAKGALTIGVLVTGFVYFYGQQGLYASQFAHRWDTFHYLLGPRYYAELDYDDLYACALRDIPDRLIDDDWRTRDLRTYRMTTVGKIREQKLCEDNFTPERRERWKKDLELFTVNGGYRVLKGAIEDRGYNGTPFHSAVAGFIADHIPLTQATHQMVPLLDIGMLSLMLTVVTWSFGWELGLVLALFFFTNAADRFGIIGGSFFRYQWLVTLAIGLSALRRGRYALAGVFMALSTLLNVFPVVFSAGILVRGVADWVKTRRPPRRLVRFVVAATITGLLGLGVGLLPARHLGNYTGWIENMEHHNVERFQGFGTGLKFPFIYKGHNTAKTDRFPESQRKKWFHEVRPWYRALATVVLGLALAFAARTDDDVEAATVLGFTIFFSVLGTVGYYFAVACVVVMAFHKRGRTLGGAVMLGLFFVSSLLAHLAFYETHYYRFMYNTVLSTAWSVWLILLLLWLTWTVTVPSFRRPAGSPALDAGP